jgi:hypothetical protein
VATPDDGPALRAPVKVVAGKSSLVELRAEPTPRRAAAQARTTEPASR